MLRHKNIDRICCIALAATLLISGLFVGAAASGLIEENTAMGYETRLFDQSRVHTIDIVMEDWAGFLTTATSEEYSSCHLVIDGESYKNVAIRGKGNTSLTSVQAYGNNRYSFKVEFDHYQSGKTYHGLDKLCLNNLIQDNTYMKDYFAYTLMGKMGVAAPLCSFVQVNVNGEPWGLYLAVEGVEDAFLQRNYGKNHGELYKPDSMSFGGGRGNGRDFDMNEMAEQLGFSFDSAAIPDMPEMPASGMPDQRSMPQMPGGGMPEMPTDGAMPEMPGDFDPSQLGGDFQMPGRDFGGFGSSTDVKLQYTDDDPASYPNIFDNAKTDITEADQARLIASLKALGEGDTSVVDTEAVIRYMAVHHFLCNEDSYTGTMVHNYYLYEKDGVLAMIPWDYNLAFGTMRNTDAASAVNTDIDRLVSTGADSDRPMAGWITSNEEYLARYHAVYQEFVTSVFDSGWFAEEIDRVTQMIAPYVENDPTAFCTYAEFQTGAETLRQFCLKRAESVANQLAGNPALVDTTGLNLSDMGTMNQNGGDREKHGRNEGGRKQDREASSLPADAAAPDDMPSAPADTGSPDDAPSAPADAASPADDASSAPADIGSPGDAPSAPADIGSPDDMPSAPVDTGSPDDVPSAPVDTGFPGGAPSFPENSDAGRVQPGFDAFDASGLARQDAPASGTVWLLLCTALLGAALLFAFLYKSNR